MPRVRGWGLAPDSMGPPQLSRQYKSGKGGESIKNNSGTYTVATPLAGEEKDASRGSSTHYKGKDARAYTGKVKKDQSRLK